MGLRNGFEIFRKERKRNPSGVFITHYVEIDLFYLCLSITAILDGAPEREVVELWECGYTKIPARG